MSVTWVPEASATGDGADGADGPAVPAVPVAAPDSPARVAFAIGRGVGSAVVRNRLRRRLRAVLADAGLAPGAYLVSVGPDAVHLSSSELRAAVSAALASVAARAGEQRP